MKLLQLGTIFRPLEREGSKNVSKKGIVLIVKNFSLEVSKSKKKRIGIFNSSKKQPKHEKKLLLRFTYLYVNHMRSTGGKNYSVFTFNFLI